MEKQILTIIQKEKNNCKIVKKKKVVVTKLKTKLKKQQI